MPARLAKIRAQTIGRIDRRAGVIGLTDLKNLPSKEKGGFYRKAVAAARRVNGSCSVPSGASIELSNDDKGFPSGGKERPSRAQFLKRVNESMQNNLNRNTCSGRVEITNRNGHSRIRGLTKVLAGILFCALLHASAQANPYSLKLAWNASTSPGVTGYRVYYGSSSGNYTNSLTVGNVTTATVSGLTAGVTYYFAVTGTDTTGLESPFSNQATYAQALALALAQMSIKAGVGGASTLTVSGTANHTYNIQATQNLLTWTVIGTATADANGSLTFTDPNAKNFTQRFYRTQE